MGMSSEDFDLTIETGDPDAVVAWVKENFPRDVLHITAFEIGETDRWRVRLLGFDTSVATAIKLYWHNQDT